MNHIANKYWPVPATLSGTEKVITGTFENEFGNAYFAKIIKGLDQRSQAIQMFSDKLNHLERAESKALPKIHEFGFDSEQGFFFIIFEECCL